MPEIVSAPATLLLWAALGYLLGSIPFGLLLTRALGLGDVRSIGSGNIGATNVLRTGRKGLALATLLFDLAKGALPTFLAHHWLGPDMAVVAGAGAIVGHCFPVWLGFRGGKGVATFLGTLLAVAWPLGLAACATWAATAAVFRISSASALVAAVLSPLWATLLGRPDAALLCLALAALILWRHGANIARLLQGTEPRIGRR